MILLLDIGNSRIKWGFFEGGSIFGIASSVYQPQGVAQVAERQWRNVIFPNRIIVSNVAGTKVASDLQTWVREVWHQEATFLVPQAEAHGVRNGYHDPSTLGADRWAALLGASRRPHGWLCVVDCGTAVTIDILSDQNVHLGGLILPGLGLMRKSLLSGTAGIRSTLGTNLTWYARDTGNAVAGGTLYAIVALIQKIVFELSQEMSSKVEVLLTGGDAPLVASLLQCPTQIDMDLVLRGLALYA